VDTPQKLLAACRPVHCCRCGRPIQCGASTSTRDRALSSRAGSRGGRDDLMEYREETIARLRAKLGREPTADEIKATRDALFRQAYASMMLIDMLLCDEAK
jgi:hypothetical protein